MTMSLLFSVALLMAVFTNCSEGQGAALALPSTDSLLTAGITAYIDGRYAHAVAAFQNPLYHINLGIAWAHKDSVEQAVRSYRSAVHAYRPEDIGRVYERLGGLRFSKKQFRDARDSYLKALRFDPYSGTIPLSLALTYDHLKQYKAAVTWYRKFLHTASNDPGMAKQIKETEARLKVLAPKIAGHRSRANSEE